MPRPRNPVPSYLHHKATGRAYCKVHGKPVYLGRWGSAESKAAYSKLVAGLKATGATAPVVSAPRLRTVPTVAGVVLQFLTANNSGYTASEQDHMVRAVDILVCLHGDTTLTDFGPLALSAVRDEMVARGWTRKYVNDQISRARRVFRWAESVELVPAGKWHQLRSLPGLRVGRTTAPEQRKRFPVPDDVVEAVIPHLPPTVAAMVRFQRLTGCRPQDARRLNAAEIDRAGTVWVFRPAKHKGAWRGLSREVYIGPRAQAVILPFLTGREDAPAVFSPRLAWQEWADRVKAGAKFPRGEKYERTGPRLAIGDVYPRRSHIRAVELGCIRAGVTPFSPNQLRHAAATEVRERFGLNAAQKLLGHRHASTTEVYAKPLDELAMRVVLEIG